MSLLLPTPLPVASVRRPFSRSLLVSLIVMGGFVAVLQLLHLRFGVTLSYILLLIPVAFSAWYGGSRPAGLGAVFGFLAADFWLLNPGQILPRDRAMWAEAIAYGLGVLAIILFAASFRRQLCQVSDRLVVKEGEAQRATFNEMNLRAVVRRLEDQHRELSAELARLSARLRTSEDRLRVAQENAGFCLFDWGHPGEDLFIFGDPHPVFRLDAEHWKGKETLVEAVHPEDRERLTNAIEDSLKSRLPLRLEVRLALEGTPQRWLAIRGRTTYHKHGGPARTVGIFVDITEKKLTEEALVRNEKLAAAGRLAAAIAHEVNNPLAAATNLMFIIKGDVTLSRAGRQYVEMAEQELARLGRIAKQTLGFYRESTQPCRADLCGVIDGVLDMYARNLPAGIKVRKQYPQGAEAEIIEGEIRQVFANVLVNAVQAIGEEGTVHVRLEPMARPTGKGWMLTVKDTGPGISHHDLQSLFEPFFTRKGGGTGLGLWIAKQIVERHHGTIEVESSTLPEGHGTKVVIFLPAEQVTEKSAAESSVA
jgi:signal transduction histidine kinase